MYIHIAKQKNILPYILKKTLLLLYPIIIFPTKFQKNLIITKLGKMKRGSIL